jgi:hypothetical protein
LQRACSKKELVLVNQYPFGREDRSLLLAIDLIPKAEVGSMICKISLGVSIMLLVMRKKTQEFRIKRLPKNEPNPASPAGLP